MSSTRPRTILIGIALAIALVLSSFAPAQASTGALVAAPAIPGANADYARLVQLQASADASKRGALLTLYSVNDDGTRSHFEIRRSVDNGATWSTISTIYSPTPNFGIYTGTLYELPRASGGLPAGALLAAGTAWNGPAQAWGTFRVQTFVSLDYGVTWTSKGDCVSKVNGSTSVGTGIWEPEFTLLDDDRLACYYSDENPQAQPNQVLAMSTSTDGGATWGNHHQIVALSNSGARPGMPIVRRLPNGTFALALEYCDAAVGNADQTCRVYFKTSPDGDSWTVNSLGTLVATADGRQLLHTPGLAWTPVGGPNGTLLITGQRVVTGSDGPSTTVVPESGRVLFASTTLGVGAWSEVSAPITVDPTGDYNSAPNQFCANYSPSLVPTASGQAIQMVTPYFVPGQSSKCEVRFGVGPVGQMPLYAPFDSLNDMGWATYGGSWSVASGGVYKQTTQAAGPKSLVGSTGWTDYTVNTDVRFDSSGQAGVVVRASQPGIGADVMKGYYAGIYQATGALVIGRIDGYWTQLSTTPLTGPALGSWGNLRVTVVGCTITARYQPLTSGTVTTTTATDTTNCIATGQAGVRTQLTEASFRTFTVNAASSASPSAIGGWDAGLAGWTAYNGSWFANSGTVSQTASATAGPRLQNGITATDSTVEANVLLSSLEATHGNAGVVTRVTSPGLGVDSYNGYYAGVDGTSSQLVLGKSSGTWTSLGVRDIPGIPSTGIVGLGTHVSLRASGCVLTATAQLVTSWDKAVIGVTDPSCFASGVSGVRAHVAQASWNNFTSSPG